MDKIKIKIDGRIAEIESAPEVVADNAEYEIDFALDPREGWDMSLPITALFVRRDGSYTARILDAGATSCTMPPQTGTNIVFVGLTQDDMRTTTPATIKVHRSIRTVAHDPLPAPTEDVYAQILAAYAGIKILSGKGAPTSATQGKVNQLYRDEDTQKLYICTATDGGYTWAAVSGGSVDVDATLTKAGYAADAKAAGDAIGKKIDAPQVAQVGEVLTVEEVGEDGKPKKWKTAAVDPKSIKDMYYEGFDAIDTWIHDPDNQHISENNITLSAGEQCTVRIGDDEYKVVAENQQTGRYDYSMVLGTWDFSSVPFYFTIASEYGAEVAFGKLYTRLSDSVTAGTKISLEKNFAHTIKEKYFPKTIFTQENAPVRFGDILKNSAVQGKETVASGQASHAEGYQTTASGDNSHAEGCGTKASGFAAHAEGESTVASGIDQHVQGRRNIKDENDKYAHIVGNGNSKKASNAYTLDWEGNAWFAGNVYVGSTSGTNKDKGSVRLATEDQLTFCDRVVIVPRKNDDGTITYSASFPASVIYYEIFKGAPINAGNSVECCLMPIDPNGPLTVLSYTGLSLVQNSDGNIVLTIRFSSYTSGKQISAEIKDTISGFGTDNENRLSTVVTVTENAYLPTPTTAQVGQIVRVKSVDEYGKITETETVDIPGEEKWELIKTIDIADGAAETTSLTIDTDNNGNAFSLKKCRLFARFPAYTGETTIPNFSFSMINKITTGNHSPLCYTSGFPKLRTDGYTGTVWEVDVSGLQQYEKVMRSSAIWPADVYGYAISQTAEYWGDKRIQSITSIGGTQMIIFPGCHFELYGVKNTKPTEDI